MRDSLSPLFRVANAARGKFAALIAVLGLLLGTAPPLRADIIVSQASLRSNGSLGNILRYDEAGNFLGVLIADLRTPEAPEFGPDGKLYVPEYGANRVLRFLADGTPDGVFCTVTRPGTITFDTAGIAYVVSAAPGVILRFDANGNPLSSLATPLGSGVTRIGPDGYLYIASWESGNVSRMKTDGTGAVKLFDASAATDVAFAANGDLYVSREYNGVFRWNGTTLVPLATDFGFRIEGIRFDHSGNLIVGTADTPGYIVRVRPNGTWDTIGSDLFFPLWVTVTPSAQPADTVPPTCVVGAVVTESPTRVYIPLTVSDTGSGVAQAKLTSNSTNCRLEWTGPGGVVTAPIGTPLSISPAAASTTLRVVKLNAAQKARVEVQVWDAAGNTTLVDPVIANLEIKRRQLERSFSGIPQAERYVTLQNGTPGLTRATLWVNGRAVSRGSLTDGQVVRLDVAEWLRPGKRNTVRLAASGPRGATAVLTIGDVMPSGGAALSAIGTGGVNREFAP